MLWLVEVALKEDPYPDLDSSLLQSDLPNGQDWEILSWIEREKVWDRRCISCLHCLLVSVQQHSAIGLGSELVREISLLIHKCRASVRFVLFSLILWCLLWPLWSDSMAWCPFDNCPTCRSFLDMHSENPVYFSAKLQCLNFSYNSPNSHTHLSNPQIFPLDSTPSPGHHILIFCPLL